jgi:hypothetical protein
MHISIATDMTAWLAPSLHLQYLSGSLHGLAVCRTPMCDGLELIGCVELVMGPVIIIIILILILIHID